MPKKRTAAVAVAAVAGLIVAGGVAYASIPDSSGVIHGCRKNTDGSMRVIDDSSQSCASGWSSLNWNQTGPQGPSGVNSFEEWTGSATTVAAGSFNQSIVDCPTGKVATGGGLSEDSDFGGSNTDLVLRYEGPIFSGHSWLVGVTNNGASDHQFKATAMCVTASVTQHP